MKVEPMSSEIKKMWNDAERNPKYHQYGMLLEITEAFYKYMTDNNINKSELARRMNVHRTYITRVFQCKENLTLETIAKIAVALGCKINITVQLSPYIERK